MSIVVEKLTHVYTPGTPFESTAIRDVSLTIEDGSFVALIGHTGSGKSTLVQHLNALLRPTSGRVLVDGEDIFAKGASLKALRQRVGLVFQYPEHQIFEETVERDVAFGPRNMGLPEDVVRARVSDALALVGLDEAEVASRSPFDLSGGQRRRVAMAGVLAMEPKVLILDEPTAGLDPVGREEVLDLLKRLQRERGVTIVMISHNMDEVARCADRVAVMHHGELVLYDTPENVFSDPARLARLGLGVPLMGALTQALRKRGVPAPDGLLTLEKMESWLRQRIGGGCDAG